MNHGVIGNCMIAALIADDATLDWLCLPRYDGDPVFHALVGHGHGGAPDGAFRIELDGEQETDQRYDDNSAVLRTTLRGAGGAVEIVDFAPRFPLHGRMYRPQMVIRRVRPLAGRPRIRVAVRPRFNWGADSPQQVRGSNHVRWVGPTQSVRLNTDAPLDYVLGERAFNLDQPYDFLFGADESLPEHPREIAESFQHRTLTYWHDWCRRLAVPYEWQDAVIRAAITLKLCAYEPTGAIVAALTTSIPEAPNSGRNWDYRFCWVRDAFFTVRALNSLAATQTLSYYYQWLMNLVADWHGEHLQPVFGVGLETNLEESIAAHLEGYGGMGPVRIGNQAHEHFQHDVYGSVILGAAPAFFDRRLLLETGCSAFEQLERLGERAWLLHDQPDAGIWELRTRARVHTSSAIMCWAACDRLAKIARRLGIGQREQCWRERANLIRQRILQEAWSDRRRSFVESFGGETLDASVLLMGEVGMLAWDDPRFIATVDRLSEVLGQGPHMLRYEEADDFGAPEVGFNLCAFWRLDGLARIGRREEAREYFEELLAVRNPLGLMSEDTDFRTGAPWGNFPQTYSMVGIINGAMRLSQTWETHL